MEKSKIIRGMVFTIIAVLAVACLAGCGIGTETGNPNKRPTQPVSPAAPESGEETYINSTYHIELAYPTDWSYDETTSTAETAAECEGDCPQQEMLATPTIEFTNGVSPNETRVDIYIITLSEEPTNLADYLAENRPSATFEEYAGCYITGYIYDDPTAGTNGGDVKELYFLNGTTLLHITTELFEEGGGSSEADTILYYINFTE